MVLGATTFRQSGAHAGHERRGSGVRDPWGTLVDRVQVRLFPVVTGRTGTDPIFRGAADLDLELIENRTLDGHIRELVLRPTLQVRAVHRTGG